jgi:prolipoprotein diacylglyceryl transferase
VPAPPADSLSLGPADIRLYGLAVVLGWIVWIAVTARLWGRGGGDAVEAAWACVLAAPVALVGARVFSVLTDLDAYRGDPGAAFDVASGGLGIYGAVAGGALGLLVYARARGLPVGTFLDCAVPGLCLGQAVGRLGNYFNQELFGGPTDLPWGLHVDPDFRPFGYEDVETFHPVFLYEALWDVAVFVLLGILWATLQRRFHPGAVAASYLCLYGIGRFAIEGLRIDPAIDVGSLRVNQVISLGVVATGFLVLVLLDRRRVQR